MQNSLQNLISQLSEPQKAAIEIIRLSLNCFNSADGTGLFSGVARYNILAGRITICAVKTRSLPSFWAALLKSMQWPVPPKSADAAIIEKLAAPDSHAVLRVLATETESIVTLARVLHDADKQARRELYREQRGQDAVDELPFNDKLGFGE